jgi:hypothetical protein
MIPHSPNLKSCVGAFCVLAVSFAWLLTARAVDRSDPSATYTDDPGHLSIMTAGNRAIVFFWGEHLNASDSSCDCFFDFKKTGDGMWRMTEDPASDPNFEPITMRVDNKGLSIDAMLSPRCCGVGIGGVSDETFEHARPPELCKVVEKNVPQLKEGMIVLAVNAPPGATLNGSPAQDDNESKRLVRARIGAADKLLIVPTSALSCTKAKPVLQPKIQEAHDTALKLFKSGKKTDAAQLLVNAAGSKPWTINNDNVAAYNDLGFFLEQTKQYKEAIEVLNAVVADFPDRTVAYLNLGDAYMGLGDTEKAKTQYRKYVELMGKIDKKNKIPERVLKAIKD